MNPDNKSNSLSAFGTGKLSPGGTTAVDDATVSFKLDGPMGNFPYIVSSDNYNAIILPASVTDTSAFATANIPTSGRVHDRDLRPGAGRHAGAEPQLLGHSGQPWTKVEFQFFGDLAAQVTAFQAGDLDVDRAVLGVRRRVAARRSRGQRHRAPLDGAPPDPHAHAPRVCSRTSGCVRRWPSAIDREAIIAGLFEGKAEIGNDSPFFSLLPVEWRRRPCARTTSTQAKALMAEAAPDGFDVTLYGFATQEIPDLAVLVQNAAKEIGINVTIEMRDDYYDNYWVKWDHAGPRLRPRHHRLRPPWRARRVP